MNDRDDKMYYEALVLFEKSQELAAVNYEQLFNNLQKLSNARPEQSHGQHADEPKNPMTNVSSKNSMPEDQAQEKGETQQRD